MSIPKPLRLLLITLSLLYGLVSGFGMAAMGAMPMTGIPACAMLGHESKMCPMSAADHFAAWEGAFRAVPERRAAVPVVILASLAAVAPAFRGKEPERLFAAPPGWPPGSVPLYVRMVVCGAHQRLTYG